VTISRVVTATESLPVSGTIMAVTESPSRAPGSLSGTVTARRAVQTGGWTRRLRPRAQEETKRRREEACGGSWRRALEKGRHGWNGPPECLLYNVLIWRPDSKDDGGNRSDAQGNNQCEVQLVDVSV
jgi:hypothetical protein